MVKLLLLATAALVCCGCECSFADTYTVDVDPAFTPEQTQDVLEALDEWETMTGVLHFNVVTRYRVCDDSCAHEITIHPSSLQGIISLSGVADAVGYTSTRQRSDWRSAGDWANSWISTEMPAKIPVAQHRIAFQAATKHEIGHQLGLVHVYEGHALMRPAFYGDDQSRTVTCNDACQYAQVRGQVCNCE